MKAHYYFYDTVVAGGSSSVYSQINILPTLGDFSQLVNQAQFYQQYKIRQISYSLKVVNSLGGALGTRLPMGSLQPVAGLLDVFKVRVESDQIPDPASEAYYTAYNNMSHHWSDQKISGSFVPFVSVSQGDSRTFKQGQFISTSNLLMKAYGESILLKSNDYGLAPMTYIITGIVTAHV